MARKAAAVSRAAPSETGTAEASTTGSRTTKPSRAKASSAKTPSVETPPLETPPAGTPPARPKRASRKTTPSLETLAELGLARLSGLVLSETARNPVFKKLVTAAVASLQGPDAVAALIDRRLTALERSEGYVDWQKQRAFAADLDAMLTTVVDELAILDPGAALDRLIRFLGGAADVLGRVDDSSGRLHGVYERAADAAATFIVGLSGPEAATVSLRLVARIETDGYGLVERLLHDLIPQLPEAALAPLDAALAAAMPPPDAEMADDMADHMADEPDWLGDAERSRLLRMRQALADRTGDVDAYIAFEIERAPGFPDTAAIAERLLAAGRAAEALDWIRGPGNGVGRLLTREDMLFGTFEAEAFAFPASGPHPARVRAAVEIRILDALGRGTAAQELRWREFEESLDREILRAYLARLPDFEDDDALERAFAVAEAHDNPYAALAFLTHWPDHARAARLVTARRGDWDGRHYAVLAPAAEALEQTQPLAATELYRFLIDDILERGRSTAYGYAARYLTALGHLGERLEPGGISPDPDAYREGLRRRHGRKAGFWAQVRG